MLFNGPLSHTHKSTITNVLEDIPVILQSPCKVSIVLLVLVKLIFLTNEFLA